MIAKDNQKPILSLNSQKSPTSNTSTTQYKIIQNPNKMHSQQQTIINNGNSSSNGNGHSSSLFSSMLQNQFLKPTSIINSFNSSNSVPNSINANTHLDMNPKQQINLNVSWVNFLS